MSSSNPLSLQKCYELLKLPADASLEDVRKQHNKLAKLYHPDKQHFTEEICTANFVQIREAYMIIKQHLLQQNEENMISSIRDTRNRRQEQAKAAASREAWNCAAHNKRMQQHRNEWDSEHSPVSAPIKPWKKVKRQQRPKHFKLPFLPSLQSP